MNKLKTSFLFVFSLLSVFTYAENNLPVPVDNSVVPTAENTPAAPTQSTTPAVPSQSTTPSVPQNTTPSVPQPSEIDVPTISLSPVYTVDNLPIGNSYVSNPDGVISAGTAEDINRIMRRLEEEGNYQALFVAVNKISPENAHEFAVRLGNKLGVGDSTNNGVVVVLAKELREIAIAPGTGTEKILTDAKCQEIIDVYFIPNFKNGDWDRGMHSGAVAIKNNLVKKEKTEVASEPEERHMSLTVKGILLAIAAFFIWIFTSGEKCPKCGKKLKKSTENFTDEDGNECTREIIKCTKCDHFEVIEQKKNGIAIYNEQGDEVNTIENDSSENGEGEENTNNEGEEQEEDVAKPSLKNTVERLKQFGGGKFRNNSGGRGKF